MARFGAGFQSMVTGWKSAGWKNPTSTCEMPFPSIPLDYFHRIILATQHSMAPPIESRAILNFKLESITKLYIFIIAALL